jgi:hypothetical protein
MRRTILAGAIGFAVLTGALIAVPVAGATTYNNDETIIIPSGGNANPYPSSITVSGTAPPITDINVGLDGFTHSDSAHVGIVLVAPSGLALGLVDCVGDTASAAFVTLDSEAATHLPEGGAVPTGTFKPTSHCPTAESFPEPGPLTTYASPGPGGAGNATFASAFNGSSPIGTWNLFVRDFIGGDGGSINGGWSLDVNPDVTPLPAVTPTPISTPTPTHTPPPKKKCKKKGKSKKAGAAAKCKKKTKKK